jgi:hypothetical protein
MSRGLTLWILCSTGDCSSLGDLSLVTVTGEDVVGCKDSQLITPSLRRRDAQRLDGVPVALKAQT